MQCKIKCAAIKGCLYLFQDYVGLRAVFFTASSVLTLFVFGLLAFTHVPPLVSTIILGVTYSCAGVSFLYDKVRWSGHHNSRSSV